MMAALCGENVCSALRMLLNAFLGSKGGKHSTSEPWMRVLNPCCEKGAELLSSVTDILHTQPGWIPQAPGQPRAKRDCWGPQQLSGLSRRRSRTILLVIYISTLPSYSQWSLASLGSSASTDGCLRQAEWLPTQHWEHLWWRQQSSKPIGRYHQHTCFLDLVPSYDISRKRLASQSLQTDRKHLSLVSQRGVTPLV